jgi:hypothetical protein
MIVLYTRIPSASNQGSARGCSNIFAIPLLQVRSGGGGKAFYGLQPIQIFLIDRVADCFYPGQRRLLCADHFSCRLRARIVFPAVDVRRHHHATSGLSCNGEDMENQGLESRIISDCNGKSARKWFLILQILDQPFAESPRHH